MCESYLSGVILQEKGAENINEELLVWIKLLLKAGNPIFLKAYCVCVCERERERERQTHTHTQLLSVNFSKLRFIYQLKSE